MKENMQEYRYSWKPRPIFESSDVGAVVVLGDVNAHPREPFELELLKFCLDQKWQSADIERQSMARIVLLYIVK